MTESWKQWEGHVVNGEFPMQRYLGGSDHSAVFLTQRRAGEPRKAVIKFVPADLNDSESQILRWKLATKLPHRHLLRIFDVGRCELAATGFLYVVLECADEDLSQILPQRALTPVEAKDVLQSVLQAVGYLHGKGFAHGRIKPANIMATADQVKVASDTLAATGEKTSQRLPSIYDPPEAASGSVTPAGDVWSLGITLVEALTQRPPVRDGTRQPAVPKNLPEPFREIVRNCLKLDPEGRWTVAQIAARLEGDASGVSQPAVPVATKPAAPAPVLPKPSERRKRWSYIVPVAAAGLALVLIAGSRMRNPGAQGEDPSVTGGEKQDTSSVPPQPSQPSADSGSVPAQEASAENFPRSRDSGSAAPTRGSRKTSASLQPAASTAKERQVSVQDVPAGVLHRELPNVSPSARRTIQGKVRVNVRVAVDASGNVVEAALASPGPSKYFARLAEEAARDWKFAPAVANGQPAASEWMLRFAFGRTATEVIPVRMAR